MHDNFKSNLSTIINIAKPMSGSIPLFLTRNNKSLNTHTRTHTHVKILLLCGYSLILSLLRVTKIEY